MNIERILDREREDVVMTKAKHFMLSKLAVFARLSRYTIAEEIFIKDALAKNEYWKIYIAFENDFEEISRDILPYEFGRTVEILEYLSENDPDEFVGFCGNNEIMYQEISRFLTESGYYPEFEHLLVNTKNTLGIEVISNGFESRTEMLEVYEKMLP